MSNTSPNRPPITVLCVDDEPNIARTVSLILQAQGFQVFTAQSPEEARSVAAQNRIDVALVDYSVCQKNRVCVRELLPDVKCILHSGNPELADRPDCLAHVVVLPKPVHPETLIATIRERCA